MTGVMTIAVDLEEVRLADLITVVEEGRLHGGGTDDFGKAIEELIRWMRPRAIAFLSRRVGKNMQQALRDTIDGVLLEFIVTGRLGGYLGYRDRAEAAGKAVMRLKTYLFGGRR